jgi:hypothetical protein
MQISIMLFSEGHRFGRCEQLEGAKNLWPLPQFVLASEILTCTWCRCKCRRRFTAPQNDKGDLR